MPAIHHLPRAWPAPTALRFMGSIRGGQRTTGVTPAREKGSHLRVCRSTYLA
jgi:hypothetical protein